MKSLAVHGGPNQRQHHLSWPVLAMSSLVGGLVVVLLLQPWGRRGKEYLPPLKTSAITSSGETLEASAAKATLSRDLEALRGRLTEREKQLQEALAGKDRAASDDNATLSRELEVLRGRLVEREKQLQEARAGMDQATKDVNATLSRELEALRGRLVEREKQLQEALAGKDQATSDGNATLSRELEALRGRLVEREKQLQEALAGKDQATEQLRQKEDERLQSESETYSMFEDAKRDMYRDSVVLRNYLRSHAPALEAAWRERMSKRRRRGLVISAGSAFHLANAFVTLHVLRHYHNCSLPAAVIYWGSDVTDHGEPQAMENVDMKALDIIKGHIPDVELMDASKVPYAEYQNALDWSRFGLQVKTYSIYVAPFQEVLFLDSDSIPLLEPSCLFETEEYRRHGNLFWPDYWSKNMGGWVPGSLYSALRLESPWDVAEPALVRQAETGQLLLDRLRHWEMLEWLLFLNARSSLVYRISAGDKDTFRLAFHLAGKKSEYQQVPHYPSLTLKQGIHVKGILQLHPNGTAMFNHHNQGKYNLDQNPSHTSFLTAPSSEELSEACVSAPDMLCPGKRLRRVDTSNCTFTLWDWPATQRSCMPSYDEKLPRGNPQQLPIYAIPQDSYFARVEAAGDAAFKQFKEALQG